LATVTIIMPTYERARFIGLAIESALAQTYTDFVLSIGDNSSTSETEAVVRRYDDPRVTYTRHPCNLGPLGNWLELIRGANTPFVATLHDDDMWHADLLEKLVLPLIDDPSIAMSFGDFWLVDERGGRLHNLSANLSRRTRRDSLPAGRMQPSRGDGVRLAAVWNAPNPAICAVMRRDAILACDYPDDVAQLYDIWTDYQLVRQGAALYYVPERLSDYRWHGGSWTSAGFARSEDAVFERIIAENPDQESVLAEVRRYWASIRWGRAVRHMRTGSRAESQSEFLSAQPHLPTTKQWLATAAGRSALAWHALRRVQGVSSHG
jgi:glycosyltransferase involved in cell wall biosynthesis